MIGSVRIQPKRKNKIGFLYIFLAFTSLNDQMHLLKVVLLISFVRPNIDLAVAFYQHDLILKFFVQYLFQGHKEKLYFTLKDKKCEFWLFL